MSITFTQKVFPPFRLDPINQCLWRQGERISLAPKAFGVLRYLVENPGRLVTQEELLEELWPETYVQPEVLRKYILDIRKVLGDPPKKPLFIETLPRRGYQFIAPVSRESSAVTIEAQAQTVPLVGRGGALADLNSKLDSALRGNRQIVFVTGEAGIGKTSVIDAFVGGIATTANLLVARGQCLEGFAGKEAYYPLLEALGDLLKGSSAGAVLDVLSAHAPAWLAQFPFAIKPERREVLQSEIIGMTRERMVRELCEALERLAADQAVVLILEDLHWVDDSTLDFISALARRRGAAKVLVAGTYRPVEVILSSSPLKGLKQDLLIRKLCSEISLDRLTEAEVEEFLTEQFPESPVARALSGTIHQRSDGNPMFMVAMVEQLRETGMVREEGGQWVLTPAADGLGVSVPPTLQQMLEIQLEQLSADDIRLLRVASVAGRRFSAWVPAALLGGDPLQHEAACEQLARRQQFLRRVAGQEETIQYEFRHALYREILYGQIPAAQARAMHLRLAERMEALAGPNAPAVAAELAVHWEAGRNYARAASFLVQAAANAARRYAHDDALRLLRHALEMVARAGDDADGELEIRILEKISDALYAQGEMEQSAEIDNRAAELAARRGFTVAQVDALTRLARVLAFLEPERCVVVCERAVEVSRPLGDELLQARAEVLAASWRIVTHGWNAKDAAVCSAAREKIQQLSNELPAYYEILYAHVLWIQGDYEGAYKTAQAGIAKAVQDDSLVVYLSAHSSLAQALLALGRVGELEQVLERALDVAGKNRNHPWLGIFQAAEGWLRFQMRDLDAARRIAEELLRSHTEEPPGQVRTTTLVTLAFVDLESGQVDRALQRFTRICERPVLPRFFLDWHWRLIGQLGLASARLAKGDLQGAEEVADLMAQKADAIADPGLKALGWDAKARVAMAAKRGDAARQYVDRALAALAPVEVPFSARRVHATAAECCALQGDAAGAAMHRARAQAG